MKLETDVKGKPTVLQLGSLSFYVIQRGDRLGVRIKDKTSPMLAAFKGIDEFPIRPEWRVVARFEPYKDKKIPIANIIGQVEDNPSPGAVVFDWQGKTYRIDALEGGPDGSLFLVFGDRTNGTRDLRRRPLPRHRSAEGRQGGGGLQHRLQPPLRLHRLRHLPAAAGREQAGDQGRGRREEGRRRALRLAGIYNQAIHG